MACTTTPMAWIHDLPYWLVGLAIVTIFVAGALGGFVVTRPWMRRRGLHELIDNGVIGWIFSATLSIYAITDRAHGGRELDRVRGGGERGLAPGRRDRRSLP